MAAPTSPARLARTPSVVLVHGAFSDSSAWSGVVADLQARGLEVAAPGLGLRGIAADAEIVVDAATRHDGPVLLVGHCYGGAVVTAAAGRLEHAVGLVYVAGFVLDAGESVVDITARFPETPLARALRPSGCRDAAGDPAIELYVAAEAFHDVIAGDLPAATAAVMAATQRPIAAAALEEPATGAAWRALPSWYAVLAEDRAVHPEAQRFMARRAGATTVELPGSHALALADPGPLASLIAGAACSGAGALA